MWWMVLAAQAGSQPMGPGRLAYAVHDQPQASAQDHTFKGYAQGTTVWVATKDAGLYPEPGQTTYKPLMIGDELVIAGGRNRPETYDGQVDHWYQVRSPDGTREGYVFGAKLTDVRLSADFDQDGTDEVVVAAMNGRFEVEVTFVDGKRTDTVALPTRGGSAIGVRGGLVEVSVVDAAEAGVPLVRVHRFVEAPAPYATAWLSYVPSATQKKALARVALEVQGSDLPPLIEQPTVALAPNKTATLTTMSSSPSAPAQKQVTALVWKDGAYVPAPAAAP